MGKVPHSAFSKYGFDVLQNLMRPTQVWYILLYNLQSYLKPFERDGAEKPWMVNMSHLINERFTEVFVEQSLALSLYAKKPELFWNYICLSKGTAMYGGVWQICEFCLLVKFHRGESSTLSSLVGTLYRKEGKIRRKSYTYTYFLFKIIIPF